MTLKKDTENRSTSVFIETYGCQMNKYDSELITGLLTARGFRMTASGEDADIILINTCSVREHAEKRALGRARVLSGWKRQKPDRKIGIIGCMAQRLGEDLLVENPFLDFVIGPDEYRSLPGIISNGKNGPSAHRQFHPQETYGDIQPRRGEGICGWVAITRGCDNFCSYCIVPYTRGRERSRPVEDILREMEDMARQGYKEVTLLGQNVNAYEDGGIDFARLLRETDRVPAILRLRFMTSHPKDLTDDILKAMADTQNVCPHLHLPVQAGSDRILKAMNRQYTREQYLERVDEARRTIPGLSITSDIMVGFPGETESDFQDTVHLMETVRFDEAYTYRYSPRPGTKAADREDHLTEQERLKRLDTIIRIQRKITGEKKKALVGQAHEVLPETESKKSPEEWMGRTPANHVVVFPKENTSLGQPVRVLIEECRGSTLRGRMISDTTVHSEKHGGNHVDR